MPVGCTAFRKLSLFADLRRKVTRWQGYECHWHTRPFSRGKSWKADGGKRLPEVETLQRDIAIGKIELERLKWEDNSDCPSDPSG